MNTGLWKCKDKRGEASRALKGCFKNAAKLVRRTCLSIRGCWGRFWDSGLRLKEDLQWRWKEGGGFYLGITTHTALTLLCCQILLHDMKLKYQSGLGVEWFDLSVELSNQQFTTTARLSACDKTCDECLSCQLWLMAELLRANRVLRSGKRRQPSKWRPQLPPLSSQGCGCSHERYQRRWRRHK